VRRTYACLLELADASGRDPLTARALAKQWVGRSYGGWPDHAPEVWNPAPGVTVRWQLLHDPDRDDEAFELTWTRPHGHDGTLWRTASVQIMTMGGDTGRVLVTEQLESADPKVLDVPVDGRRRPDLIADVVRSARCVDGGWPVSPTARVFDADAAAELDAFVRGDRRLPVVLIGADERDKVRADVTAFCDQLVGVAHIVTLTTVGAVGAVDRELGTDRGVPEGGVRLLWPAWRSSDPPGRHPRWSAEDVAGPDGPRARVLDTIVARVFDAATLHVEPKSSVQRLLRGRVEGELQQRRADLDKLRQAVDEDRAAAEELISEYQSELSLADARAHELEVQLEQEHALRVRSEEAYLWVASQTPTNKVPEVPTLAAAVRLAQSTMPHLVVLPDAERSARGWQFDRADLVWDDLRKLEAVAAEWEAGTLVGDFATAARARGLDWVRDISEQAARKEASDYLRTYDGRTIRLGPHLRRGGRQLLRIYCYLDDESHKVVVGHVGGHLSDRTT
jgi:hypothetical protein